MIAVRRRTQSKELLLGLRKELRNWQLLAPVPQNAEAGAEISPQHDNLTSLPAPGNQEQSCVGFVISSGIVPAKVARELLFFI